MSSLRHPVPWGLAVALLLGTGPAAPGAAAKADETIPSEWRTPAEIAEFEATPSYDETLAFIRRIEAAAPAVRLEFFGESAAGRPMPVVIVSKERAFTAEAARANLKPILLVLNGIHAGEIDGKDATLLLLRDLALGRRQELLDAATILFVPIYNVDGHERVSPWNRPNQNGPVRGMGFRTTADGHDLNRDFLKLETPEARNLIALYNDWQPQLVVDNHVTNGVDLDWVVTWAIPVAPQLPAPVDRWLQAAMPQILFDVEQHGHLQGPYVSLLDPLDPAQGFESFAAEPRFSTGYFPLRNRPVILVETHSHKPYRDRVLATRDFVAATVRQVGARALELRSAIASAALETVRLGQPSSPASRVAVTFEAGEPGEIRVPFYDWKREPSVVSGGEMTSWRRGKVRETLVPWHQRLKVAESLPRPRGYVVLPGWTEISRRIAAHGLRYETLPQSREADVETTRLSDPVFAAASYQGRTRVSATARRELERRTIPAGSLWIPADQPEFDLAVQLLEPEAPDSLFAWGFLSGIFEGKEYIDRPALDEFARRELAKPEVRAAWENALADPAFAVDGEARYRWWFQRTPWWDEQIGLYPVFRLLTPLPAPGN